MGSGQWYNGSEGGNMNALNIYVYGNYNHYKGDTRDKQYYWSDAISYNCHINKIHFGRKHKYLLEWDLPGEETGTGGYMRWFLDNEIVMKMDGEALKKRGFGAKIMSEPSYILLNTAVSFHWVNSIAS